MKHVDSQDTGLSLTSNSCYRTLWKTPNITICSSFYWETCSWFSSQNLMNEYIWTCLWILLRSWGACIITRSPSKNSLFDPPCTTRGFSEDKSREKIQQIRHWNIFMVTERQTSTRIHFRASANIRLSKESNQFKMVTEIHTTTETCNVW